MGIFRDRSPLTPEQVTQRQQNIKRILDMIQQIMQLFVGGISLKIATNIPKDEKKDTATV